MLMQKIPDPWTQITQKLTYLISSINRLIQLMERQRAGDGDSTMLHPSVSYGIAFHGQDKREHLFAFAQRYLAMRRAQRGGLTKLFHDPAWDIMIDLFVMGSAGKKVTVNSACIASGSPPTTALRYIVQLERHGMIYSLDDRHDQRLRIIKLTAAGEEFVMDCLKPLAQIGEPIAG